MFNILINVISFSISGFIALAYDDFELEKDYVINEPSLTISNKGIYVQQTTIGMKAPIKGIG